MTDIDTTLIRDAFDADLADYLPSADLVERAQRGGRRRLRARRRIAVAGTTLTATVTALAVLAVTSDAPALTTDALHPVVVLRGPSIQLAGMPVHLPAGYRVTAGTTASCQNYLSLGHHHLVVFQLPRTVVDGPTAHPKVFALNDTLLTAPDNAKGCIHSNLSEPYEPPAGVAADSPLLAPHDGATVTNIDGNRAEYTAVKVLTPSNARPLDGTALYVRVVGKDGTFRLLMVIGWGVPAGDLVDLATQALT